MAPVERRRTRAAGAPPSLFLVPYVSGLAVLVVGPVLLTLAVAFTDYDTIRPATFTGIDNFTELAGDRVFRIAIRNSLVYLALSIPLRILAATGLALLLHRTARGTRTARVAAYVPTVVPDAAYALLWLWLLNPIYGPINALLGILHLPQPGWFGDPSAAMGAVVLMSVFQVGEGFLVAMAVRQEIPLELYETAAVEGASPLQSFRRVTLPMMLPTLGLLVFRDTVFSLQTSFVPALLVTDGGPPPYATTFVPLFVYRNSFQYLRFGYGAAATLVMLAVTALIVAVQYRILRRWRAALAP